MLDQAQFASLAEQFRRPLHVHCYRLLGNVEDAEDLVQDTLLRAWRSRATFQGRALFRTWLYRIATNACLNALQRAPRRVLPMDVALPASGEPRSEPPYHPEIPWLRPYPDALLAEDPQERAITRETIELAYLAALQHLPARQRAILVLRDALDFSARETAELLETSVAAVNSALQRARATLRAELPSAPSAPTEDERRVLERFVDAFERADNAALLDMLREDARWAMPPAALWFDGRAHIQQLLSAFPIGWQGDFRLLPTGANRQPAAAVYLRLSGAAEFHLVGLHVLRVHDGQIAALTTFGPELCRSFALPMSFP